MQEEIRKVYDTLTDEELIRLIQDRDDQQAQDYLLDKYKEFVKIKAARYFLVGAEKEDIIQEGMIGLFKAIRDYRPGKQASFKVFAEICVNRQIISAIKSATRQKHRPLNCYVSLDKPVFEEGKERTLLDMLGGGHGVDPENLLVDQEAFMDIEKNVTSMLSPLEWQALCKYLESKSYQQIAQELRRSTKSIDNALQRVKRKLEKYLASRNHELDLVTLNKGLLIMAAKEHLRGSDEKNDRIETI
ncbi:RNA polymerase sporulation sigma factor SigH [Acidaminococcus massiliensis]|uniref:RNA polymerase sporulation sigma factor SigH n=1 Tax=Acidaminococcus massiliensis TaxID=1852375 RepID=UPI00094E4C5A|nr:RNA polymerase sporulation sigma factor SigH [Acidaminococcus massiliensis]